MYMHKMCTHRQALPHGQVSQLRLQEGGTLQCTTVHVQYLVGCGSSAQCSTYRQACGSLNAECIYTCIVYKLRVTPQVFHVKLYSPFIIVCVYRLASFH